MSATCFKRNRGNETQGLRQTSAANRNAEPEMEENMTKAELVQRIAEAAGRSEDEVFYILNATLNEITKSMQSGESVQLFGFGTFLVREREPRQGKNPNTGERIVIGRRLLPAFKAGKGLKEAVNLKNIE